MTLTFKYTIEQDYMLSHSRKMAGPSHLKSLHSSYVFSFKFSSSISSSSFSITLRSMKLKSLSMKFKRLVHSFILSHLCRATHALTKAKSILIHLIKHIQLTYFEEPSKKQNNKNKLSFGSFRRHNSWCSSSHVLPIPSFTSQLYNDATWNSIISPGCNEIEAAQLSGYLQWLEQKVQEDAEAEYMNEIDKLADMFIANCHEKFLMEKQESFRMFQEMMARSLWGSWLPFSTPSVPKFINICLCTIYKVCVNIFKHRIKRNGGSTITDVISRSHSDVLMFLHEFESSLVHVNIHIIYVCKVTTSNESWKCNVIVLK